MGEGSKIQWTHHTFNPWRGCTHVSPGCEHCYAEALSKRNPAQLGTWGAGGTRVVASEAYWKQPERWNRAAEAAGERHRVFCASLADVFEDRPELVEPRERLWRLIVATPHLDWLLLTKRPENIARLLGPRGITSGSAPRSRISAAPTSASRSSSTPRRPSASSPASPCSVRWTWLAGCRTSFSGGRNTTG